MMFFAIEFCTCFKDIEWVKISHSSMSSLSLIFLAYFNLQNFFFSSLKRMQAKNISQRDFVNMIERKCWRLSCT